MCVHVKGLVQVDGGPWNTDKGIVSELIKIDAKPMQSWLARTSSSFVLPGRLSSFRALVLE